MPWAAGDWLSGRAPRSHRGGHWFDPSIAHSQDLALRQLRSSSDRPHPKPRVGSFSRVGGIWEINLSERFPCRTGRRRYPCQRGPEERKRLKQQPRSLGARAHAGGAGERSGAADQPQRPCPQGAWMASARATVCDCDRRTRRDTEFRRNADPSIAGSPPQRLLEVEVHAHCPGTLRRCSAIFRCLARSARRRAAAPTGSPRLPHRHGGIGVDREAAEGQK